ncbi:MAG: winged helix-turn-helix transcriptional regulator [Paramuribaculum sp.]|nr:winged helix-turn-helix transcriptional regulator [Paramuribaculum sp.]
MKRALIIGRIRLRSISVIIPSTLRRFEADGLVERKLYLEVPPRVEYSLTATGRSLVPLIGQLPEWAQVNMKTIMEHREAAEQK